MDRFEKTAVYMRLSRDDEKAGESMSIENQRIILRSYVEERGGVIVDEYVDDGFSGTNFDRPAVKRMLEDAQAGKIDTIVVKDLSRFGRNYIQVGQYIDYIFPAYGIRFVAISDNVDTADRSSTAMDMMPIMNVFNEWHAANTSKKIRAVLRASQNSGKYTSAMYPYGYRAGTDETRTAVIDKDAAAVVRRIFELRAEGKSSRAIAKMLTDEGIQNPATHFTKLDGGKQNRRCSPYWWASTVRDILSDPTYIGYTVQHKTSCVSYKNHKTVRIPKSEQIVRENAHEPIISRELWDKVRRMDNSVSRGKTDGANRVHPLSGLLVCPDCGKKLKIKTTKKNGLSYFYCRTYTDLGKKYCTSHCVSEKEMENLVLNDIRSMLAFPVIDEDAAIKNYIDGKTAFCEQNRYSAVNRLKAYNNRLDELNKLIRAAFEDKVLKDMPSVVCAELCAGYQKEKTSVEEKIAETEKNLASATLCSNGQDVEEYIRRVRLYGNCESLTRELCMQLIDFITVGEKNGDGNREIHIYYNISNVPPPKDFHACKL